MRLGSRNPNNLETIGRWKIQAMAEVDIIKEDIIKVDITNENLIKVDIINENLIKVDIIKGDMELKVVVGST